MNKWAIIGIICLIVVFVLAFSFSIMCIFKIGKDADYHAQMDEELNSFIDNDKRK